MLGDELVEIWLSAVERVPQDEYVMVPFDELPAPVRGDMSMWSQRFFSDAANVQRQRAVARCGVHVATEGTPDLLRYVFPLEAARLEVFETVNFLLIRVIIRPGITEIAAAERPARVESLAAAILNLSDREHQWAFQVPQTFADGARFSTDPTVDPLYLPSWASRADGGLRHGNLYFLCYKKFFELATYRDIKTWFDAAFRAKWGRP